MPGIKRAREGFVVVSINRTMFPWKSRTIFEVNQPDTVFKG